MKKIAIASGAKDYNILQNNGKIAHQEVGHVSSHREKPWATRLANVDAIRFMFTL